MSCDKCQNSTSPYCINCYPSYFASLGGSKTSAKKKLSSKKNGKKGGRPKTNALNK